MQEDEFENQKNEAICSECNKPFASEEVLDVHMKQCHNDVTVRNICAVCSSEFTSRSSLIHHIENEHNQKADKRTCKICQKSMSYKYIRKHMENVHSLLYMSESEDDDESEHDDEPIEKQTENEVHEEKKSVISCPICQKGFTYKKNLTNHISIIHNQEKPINEEKPICEVCRISVRDKYAYKEHLMKLHDYNNDEAKNAANIPGKKTKN